MSSPLKIAFVFGIFFFALNSFAAKWGPTMGTDGKSLTKPVVCSSPQGKVWVFAVTNNNSLYDSVMFRSLSDTSANPWALVTRVRKGSAPAAACWSSYDLHLFYLELDGSVWQKSWVPFHGWGESRSVAGYRIQSIATAVRPGGRIDLFARGNDNSLWWRAYHSGNWDNWKSLGGALDSEPAATGRSPSSMVDVFYRGANNGLWQLTNRQGNWGTWQGLLGSFDTGPGACSWGSNRVDLFARTWNKTIQHSYFNGVTWSAWETLTQMVFSAPAAAAIGPDHMYLFFNDDQGAVLYKEYR
ncbi:MAG: hypothetical protein ACKOX6_08585 [Bdellovibrio sp.]